MATHPRRLLTRKEGPYRDPMRPAEDGFSRHRPLPDRAGALRQRLAATLIFCRYVLLRFNRDGCFAAAGALSYTTLVSLVPLGVIALGILSAFPDFQTVRQELLELVFRNFVPQISEQAAWWFQYFAESAAQATAIGIVGIAATGVLLLVTVEDQLNALWRGATPPPRGETGVASWAPMTLRAPLRCGWPPPSPPPLSPP